MVGLREGRGKRAAGFHGGMGQRLGSRPGVLGDQEVVVLDETVNGPGTPRRGCGIRNLLIGVAADGSTCFVVSNLMSGWPRPHS